MGATGIGDTIAALATPPGAGALAVLRISGPDALAVAGSLFVGRRELATLAGFEGAVGTLREGDDLLDEVVAWVYRAPHSYTGEDLVELSCHGGGVSAGRVLSALHRAGARPAQPGEFTQRAFVHGRIDLAQAEAVADLIAARGTRAQRQALRRLEGGLSRRVDAIAGAIRDVLAPIEAHLDFGDDVPEMPEARAAADRLEQVERDLKRLAAGTEAARAHRDGAVLVLVGKPNVGKSSLMNALAGVDRAIVDATPGTTRDVVDCRTEWGGVPVRLVDTAGWREAGEAVEREGILRSQRELAGADLILWVVDGSREPDAEDLAIGEQVDPARTWIVANKRDLGAASLDAVAGRSPHEPLRVSATLGECIDTLIEGLTVAVRGTEDAEPESEGVGNERHAALLVRAAEALGRGRSVLAAGQPVELGAADLQRALEALAEITGENAGDALLDRIFTRFCIGK